MYIDLYMEGSRDSFVHVVLLYLACSVALGALGGRHISFYYRYQCISFTYISIGVSVYMHLYMA